MIDLEAHSLLQLNVSFLLDYIFKFKMFWCKLLWDDNVLLMKFLL